MEPSPFHLSPITGSHTVETASGQQPLELLMTDLHTVCFLTVQPRLALHSPSSCLSLPCS